MANRDDFVDALRQWASTQPAEPVKFTAEMLLMKAELARLDARGATARRIERWGFAIAGAALAAIIFIDSGHPGYSGASVALAAVALTLAGCWFACALEA